MKKLRENGYIEMDREGFITLTDKGYEIASSVYNRHKLLTRFFVALGVNEQTAAADACKIEHDISEETFQKILEHAKKYSSGHHRWLNGRIPAGVRRCAGQGTGRPALFYVFTRVPLRSGRMHLNWTIPFPRDIIFYIFFALVPVLYK